MNHHLQRVLRMSLMAAGPTRRACHTINLVFPPTWITLDACMELDRRYSVIQLNCQLHGVLDKPVNFQRELSVRLWVWSPRWAQWQKTPCRRKTRCRPVTAQCHLHYIASGKLVAKISGHPVEIDNWGAGTKMQSRILFTLLLLGSTLVSQTAAATP
jgi:hypothetical protein